MGGTRLGKSCRSHSRDGSTKRVRSLPIISFFVFIIFEVVVVYGVLQSTRDDDYCTIFIILYSILLLL